ncbi:MAG: ATP-binding protein [Eubacteriales bacterium]
MSRTDNIRAAKAKIAEHRANAIGMYERHIAEVSAVIPEFTEIDRQLSRTGIKIMAAALTSSEGGPSLEEVRSEYEALANRKQQLLQAGGYPADYCDIHYFCPKCSDTGYVDINMCECLRKELILASLEASGLYSLVETQSFETFSLDYYEKDDKIIMRQNAVRLWEFAKTFVPGQSDSFLFIGATGLGKTHLSSAVARVLIEKGAYVVYESSIALFGDFEARRFGGNGYNSETGDDVDRYTDCDLLIIDDLGCEVTNSFTLSCLYNIINTRILMHKSTIINTNLTQNELRKRYTDRIISRIFGEFIPLNFRGFDVREQKLRRQK